jgi:pimeloyl-ACP methyl ester carboxylesterase
MDTKPPIVYVRGFAGGTSGINKQVDDPFYGFNDGSTHVRVDGDGDPRFYQFEGLLIRLLDDEGYQLFVGGDQNAYLESHEDGSLPPESIWVYRFYDAAASTFGNKPVPFNIEEAALGLYEYVGLIRAKTKAPRVHLVAHSMGGLVCRAMIEKVSQEEGREPGRDIVDKFFTFGTPHGGIGFEKGGGLIDWAMETFGPSGADIFSPPKMYGYLTPGAHWGDESKDPDWRPNKVAEGAFDVARIFCLIGTDPTDYGLVHRVVGPKSDGLVMIDNAYVRGANRAFVHRSHSGRYGLVNSEEGYQNLRRFLFGGLRVKVELNGLDLPTEDADEVWQADVRLSIRGLPIVMHEQLAAHYCPVQLNMEQQRHKDTPDAPVPLATVFLLDPAKWSLDPLVPPPARCRYALKLRVYSLKTKHGFFSWKDHLEQVADWEDTLIVDIGKGTDDTEQQHVWAIWKSDVAGAIEDHDPICDQPREVANDVVVVPLPQTASAILGSNARLTFTITGQTPPPQ